jgi:hypothetical protein
MYTCFAVEWFEPIMANLARRHFIARSNLAPTYAGERVLSPLVNENR